MPYGKIWFQKQDGASVVANWIWHAIVDLSIRTPWLHPKRLRSCTAPRFCRACCVSSKLSNQRAAIHVRSVFIRLHSAKYRIGNEGKQKVFIIPTNQLHIQKFSMFVSIVWQKRLQERGLIGQSKPQFIWSYSGTGHFL